MPRAVLAVIVLFYSVLAFLILSPDALYSGDVGVKYVQARSLAGHNFTSLDIPYRAEFLDPGRQFMPLRPPFIMPVGSGVQAIFSPGTAIFDALFVALAGFPGMILASLVAATVVFWTAWKLASGPAAVTAALVLAVATPWWFYGVTGWEHAPAVAFAALAFLVAWRAAGFGGALAAGALLGFGATLRDEVILLAPALAFAIWLPRRRFSAVVAAGIGAATVLALAGVVEVFWFHRPLAAHLQHAVHLLRSVLHATTTPNPEMPALAPLTLRERFDTVFVYWLTGFNGWPLAVGAAAIAAAVFCRRQLKWTMPLLIVLVAAAVFAAFDAWELIRAPKWVAGMYRLSQFLIFAVIPAPPGDRRSTWVRRVALVALVSFVALAFAGADTNGGKSLGPRLLLPLLPLLVLSAWQGIGAYLRSASPDERRVGQIGLGLVVLSAAIHLGGTIPAYAGRSRDDGSVIKYLRAAESRLIVTDDAFTAQLLLPLYYDKVLLLADTQPLADALSTMLEAQRFNSVLLVSREPNGRIVLPGLTLVGGRPIGRMVVEEWRRR